MNQRGNTIQDVLEVLDTMQGSIQGLKGQFGEMQGSIGTIEGKVNSLERSVGTLEKSVGTLERSVDTLQGSMSSIEGKVGTLERSMDTMQGKINTVQGSIDRIEVTLNQTQEAVEENREIIDFLKDNSATKEDLKNVEKTLDSRIDRVDSSLRAEIQNIHLKIAKEVDSFVGLYKKQEVELAPIALRQHRLEEKMKV